MGQGVRSKNGPVSARVGDCPGRPEGAVSSLSCAAVPSSALRVLLLINVPHCKKRDKPGAK